LNYSFSIENNGLPVAQNSSMSVRKSKQGVIIIQLSRLVDDAL
jgi:hypothetical protein